MKNVILSAVIMSFVLVSCNQKNKQEEPVNSATNKHEITTGKANPNSFSIKEIVADYLSLKNALVKDDSNGSGNAGEAMVETLGIMNMEKLSDKEMKTYMDIADDLKEHAEHIGDNAGNIAHQREHFVLMSKDIDDLIKTFGTEQKLYQDFCPMADEGKGAIWISEVKDIKNPYFGSEMLTCGSVRKEF